LTGVDQSRADNWAPRAFSLGGVWAVGIEGDGGSGLWERQLRRRADLRWLSWEVSEVRKVSERA